jgi:hypothetical protein
MDVFLFHSNKGISRGSVTTIVSQVITLEGASKVKCGQIPMIDEWIVISRTRVNSPEQFHYVSCEE